ncbi:MAG: catalase family protein [Burkholderiales bacterium]
MVEPNLDTPPPGEDAAIAAITDMLARKVRATHRPGAIVRRDAHPKHHGCVEATFTIMDGVPPDLRHGLFARSGRYSALIRFSNGSPAIQHDRRRDARGMAVKLLGVPAGAGSATGATQDFVLSSDPAFFVRNVADYVLFARAAADPDASAAVRAWRAWRFFFSGPPARWRTRELHKMLRCMIRIDNPLGIRYWSQTPYRLGPLAVKYSARPLSQPIAPASRRRPDYLRETMARQLAAAPAAFEFLVQPFVDQQRTPIEDSTIDWDERVAPSEAVARIDIPVQTVDDPVKLALAENLSFTPWHSLQQHAPLGGINRVRRAAYDTVSIIRHELNRVPREEPAAFTVTGEHHDA